MAVILFLKKRGEGFFPYKPDDAERGESLPWEVPLRHEITRPRNPDFDRLFHAMVGRIAKSIGYAHEDVLDFFKLETGHYTLILPQHALRAEIIDELVDRLRAEAAEQFENEALAAVLLEAAERIVDQQRKIENREKLQYKSIAWDKMDALEFKVFFERCVQIMYEKWKIDPALVADLLNTNLPEKRR